MSMLWRSVRQGIFLTGAVVALVGCSDEETVAPVVNGWYQPQAASSFYVVRPTDTIYSIAFAFGLDYRALVAANRLSPPYALQPGQRLVMTHRPPNASSQNTAMRPAPVSPSLPENTAPSQSLFEPVSQPVQTQPTEPTMQAAPMPHFVGPSQPQVERIASPKSPRQPQQPEEPRPPQFQWKPKPEIKSAQPIKPKWVEPVESSYFVARSGWQWPAKGRLLDTYTNSPHGRPGISIGGRLGEPVKAASSGTVVYSGDGIRGYGNLIIIKHNDTYLSAYAFNQRNMVAVGDHVQAGRVIARMGQNDAGRTLLYFEIRRNGVPVNPMPFLKK